MQCEKCKKHEATVHLTQVVEGDVKKLHLCEECAAKSGLDVNAPLSITDILVGMGVQKPASSPKPVATGFERSCPRCHMSRTDFKKGGRFGCARCYEAFADELPQLLKAMHRSDRHEGKIPASLRRKVRADHAVTDLQEQLKKAIVEERFEDAASLRDRIEAAEAAARLEQESQ